MNDPSTAVIYIKNDDGELEQIKLNWLHWLIILLWCWYYFRMAYYSSKLRGVRAWARKYGKRYLDILGKIFDNTEKWKNSAIYQKALIHF